MQFPNAYHGISKILVAQILDLILAVATTVFLVVMLELPGEMTVVKVLITWIMVLMMFLVKCAILVLRWVGLVQAKKDEEGFRTALYATVAAWVLFIIRLLIPAAYPRVRGWLDVGQTLCYLVVSEMVVISIHVLSTKLCNPAVFSAASKMQIIIVALYVVNVLLEIYQNTPNMTEELASFVVSILDLVVNILLVRFLIKAKKMFCPRTEDPAADS